MAMAARMGDAGAPHCTAYVIATGSPDVLIEGKPAARTGDVSSLHKMPGGKNCVPHVSKIVSRTSSVFVNGRPLAQVGDPLTGCTVIAQGCVSVFVGV